jgi:hypothetical protein
MENGVEPSCDDVLALMVCPAVEAKFSPPVDPEPSKRNRLRPARSPAVRSGAPNSLGPGPRTAWRTRARALCPSGTGNGIAAQASGTAAAAPRIGCPRPPDKLREVPFRDRVRRSALCKGGTLLTCEAGAVSGFAELACLLPATAGRSTVVTADFYGGRRKLLEAK